MIKKLLQKKPLIKPILSLIPLTILVFYYVARFTLSHDNMIFLTISFLLNLITVLIISFSLITTFIKYKNNNYNKLKIAFWSTLLILFEISTLFSNNYTLFEKSGVIIADVLAIVQIIYLIKENKTKGTKSNV
jgi:hypothetical protein